MWIGLKLSLPNRKNSRLPHLKSWNFFRIAFYGLTSVFLLLYTIFFIVKLSIRGQKQENGDSMDYFSEWYYYSDARLWFAKLWMVAVLIQNILATVFLSVGISNLKAFLPTYRGTQTRVVCVLTAYTVFQAFVTVMVLVATINSADIAIVVVCMICGLQLIQNILLGALANNDAFNEIYSMSMPVYFAEGYDIFAVAGQNNQG